MLYNIFIVAYGADLVCGTVGNLNNHLGLPLTLLSLNSQHKILIVELGMNHSGELDYLSRLVEPEVAVVNNYHHAHIGHFSSIAEVIAAKNEIFNHVSKLALVNSHNGYYKIAQDEINQRQPQVEFRALDTSNAEDDLQQLQIKLQVLGRHNYANALTALTVAAALGVPMPVIRQGLQSYTGYQSRLQCLTATTGAMLIDDSYNANLESTLAAIDTLLELPLSQHSQRWLVFGDLKELGAYAQPHHQRIGLRLNELGGLDLLLTVGVDSRFAYNAYHGAKVHFENNQELLQYLLKHLTAEQVVLFKGSNSMKLRDIIMKLV